MTPPLRIRTVPTGRGSRLTLSRHALEQMLAREIAIWEVAEAVVAPEATWTDSVRSGEAATVCRKGDYAVVRNDRAVVTVLFTCEEQWNDDERRAAGKVLSAGDRSDIERVLAWLRAMEDPLVHVAPAPPRPQPAPQGVAAIRRIEILDGPRTLVVDVSEACEVDGAAVPTLRVRVAGVLPEDLGRPAASALMGA